MSVSAANVFFVGPVTKSLFVDAVVTPNVQNQHRQSTDTSHESSDVRSTGKLRKETETSREKEDVSTSEEEDDDEGDDRRTSAARIEELQGQLRTSQPATQAALQNARLLTQQLAVVHQHEQLLTSKLDKVTKEKNEALRDMKGVFSERAKEKSAAEYAKQQLESELQNFKEQSKTAQESAIDCDRKLQEVTSENSALQQKLASGTTDLEKDIKIQTQKVAMDQLTQQLSQSTSSLSEKDAEIANLQLRTTTLQTELTAKDTESESEAVDLLQTEAKQKETVISTLRHDLQEKTETINSLQTSTEALEHKIKSDNERLTNISSELQQRNTDMQTLQAQLQENNEAINSLHTWNTELRAQLEQKA